VEAFGGPRYPKSFRLRSRYDRRFYAVGALVLIAAVAGKFLGADGFNAYPTVALGIAPATAALSALVVLAGLAPVRRRAPRTRNA
jgi:hypothetical protein